MKIIGLTVLFLVSVAARAWADDTSDWYPYLTPSDPTATSLDLSFLNEHPAGGHGFVQIKDGHFSFQDGTPARFWGTNLVGSDNFLTHDQADALALRLSRLGVNLLRLHMADTGWLKDTIFASAAKDTLTLDPGQVDKLDYLVSALKKNGIYLYPDWLVLRKFREGDGVSSYKELDYGAKGVALFDPRVIELNKQFATELLGHLNPYTGMALKDDPVYIGNEIANESSVFCGFGEQKFPQYYWDELQKLYEAWGGHGAITHFRYDWGTSKLLPGLHPENAQESMKFLLFQMTKTNLEMKEFLSKLSSHALLSGSNMGLPVLGNIRGDANLDFMDTHAYWDYPQMDKVGGDWSKVDAAAIYDVSETRVPFQSSIPVISRGAVEGKPLLVSEWNNCFPNQYRAEGPLLMAAYGSLQDWGGLLQFSYGADLPGMKRMDTFSINRRPENEPTFQAGALIFREGLLKRSETLVLENLSDRQVLANGMRSNWLYDHSWLPFVARVAKRFTGDKEEAAPDLADLKGFNQTVPKKVLSSTGEEMINYDSAFLKLDCPSAQGFSGLIGVGHEFRTTDLSMNISNRNAWAVVLAVALDQKPLASSDKFVVLAVAKSQNSGQIYNSTHQALLAGGAPPILMQGVQGDISVRIQGGTFTVKTLDSSGNPGGVVPSSVEEGRLKFNLSPADHSSYYLVEKSNP